MSSLKLDSANLDVHSKPKRISKLKQGIFKFVRKLLLPKRLNVNVYNNFHVLYTLFLSLVRFFL